VFAKKGVYMQSIFFLFIFVVSFCFGAFAQNVSDEMTGTESSGKSLDTYAGNAGTMDTDVVPQADIPEAGAPAATQDLITDDGTTAAGDYEKVPKSISDSDEDLDLQQSPPKRPAVSANASDSDTGLDAGVSDSDDGTAAPGKSEPSDTYGE
jgi:hypothetical protein